VTSQRPTVRSPAMPGPISGGITDQPSPGAALEHSRQPLAPAEWVLWFVSVMTVMASFAWLVAHLAPRPLRRTDSGATGFPMVSGALGALVLISASQPRRGPYPAPYRTRAVGRFVSGGRRGSVLLGCVTMFHSVHRWFGRCQVRCLSRWVGGTLIQAEGRVLVAKK
jgi:hypothetical protein